NAHVSAVAVALDRCERGIGTHSALDEIKATGIKVLSIITVHDLIAYLEKNHDHDKAQTLSTHLKTMQ
ncbi:MAG TPA: orotate phosphoribosyltransferase, partial [Legionellaceae bacterium]|nr:orotate phosphoribosyltransferase [Legionellaceae bacterium]